VFILHPEEQFLSLQQGDGAGGVYGAFVHGSLFLFRSVCKDKTFCISIVCLEGVILP